MSEMFPKGKAEQEAWLEARVSTARQLANSAALGEMQATWERRANQWQRRLNQFRQTGTFDTRPVK